jgi:hypothetical protein
VKDSLLQKAVCHAVYLYLSMDAFGGKIFHYWPYRSTTMTGAGQSMSRLSSSIVFESLLLTVARNTIRQSI